MEVALDALEEATKALSKITKNHITEIKSLGKPPEAVITCLGAVAVLLGSTDPGNWTAIQKMISVNTFLKQCQEFDINTVTGETAKKLEPFTSKEDFNKEEMTKKSKSLVPFVGWVLAIKAFADEK